jgi:hypothetical protein
MFSNKKTARCLALALFALGSLAPQSVAQGVHYHGGVRCNSGHCGSPLSGPCVPQRMTYGYVPTSWRRWPTDHVATGPLPEQIPTPAKEPRSRTKSDELPMPSGDPGDTSPADGSPQLPADEPSLTPPFGSEPATPPFGNEPQTPPFGDAAPVPPPSTDPLAVPPLAVPPSDEPPTPPADAPESTPATDPTTTDAAPPESTPTNATPPLDSDGPPTLPTDDPFKDDPEAVLEPTPGAGTRNDRNRQAEMQRLASMRTRENAGALASEPRLLRADGGNLEANRLPQTSVETNPLRQVSHPVRKTSAAVATPPKAVISSGREQDVWRKNPLRSN